MVNGINKKDLSVVISGQAGQGVQTIGNFLTSVARQCGYHVFSTNEFMSRVRGGCNSMEVRISNSRVASFVDRADIFIPLSSNVLKRITDRVSPDTVILGEDKILDQIPAFKDLPVINVPFSKIAREIKNPLVSNTVAGAVVLGFLDIEMKTIEDYLRNRFDKKGDKAVRDNIDAALRGFEIGRDLSQSGKISFNIEKSEDLIAKDEIILNGGQAVSLGAAAGGCNFISAYPMSPSTAVLTYLSQHSEELAIITDQAEDEIAAINMAIGAWYAGARALVSTSGGGFALMEEGVSLAGIMEMPLVIHIAQRPGPGTGLPTRTEQGDLELALYSGHGEFPRIIFAPGSLEECFYLTQKTFNLAARYQVPVFILTDQYLMDSNYNLPSLDVTKLSVDKHIVETDSGYKRYELDGSGFSARGIPGFGRAVVSADSHEHDEDGHISEDLEHRVKIVGKRLKKLSVIEDDIMPPFFMGPEDYKYLVIGWGSTKNAVIEAIRNLGRDDLSFLHFSQVYPMYKGIKDCIQKANLSIVIENNATSQLGKLLKLTTSIEVDKKLLKFNGLTFSVEEIKEGIDKIIREEGEINGES